MCIALSRIVRVVGKILVILLLGLMLALPSRAEEAPSDVVVPRPTTDAGIAAFEAGDYNQAVADFSKAQQEDPSYSLNALYLGLAYEREGKLPDAVQAWRKYVSLKPIAQDDQSLQLEMTTEYLPVVQRQIDHENFRLEIAREQQIGPGDPSAIAISYYRNLGSADLQQFQKGLTAFLIADASKVPGLKVAERDKLEALLDEMKLGSSGLADPTTAARAGRLIGAGKVVSGSYVDPAKAQMSIHSVVAETSSSKVLGDQNVGGEQARFLELEKELLVAVLKDIGYDQKQLEAAGVWTDIHRPQTTSIAAFEDYSYALDAKDKQDYPAAKNFIQQALKLDPNFELAKHELLEMPIVAMTSSQLDSQVSGAAKSVARTASSQSHVRASVNIVPPSDLASCNFTNLNPLGLALLGANALPSPGNFPHP